MVLVIDVGNTNTVVGAYEETALLDAWRFKTLTGHTADELGVMLRQLFDVRGLPHTDVDGAIVSCVVPTMVATVRAALQRYFDVDPLVVGPGIRTQMPILYDNPREVGADRIVNAVAAHSLYQDGLIVVDFGTATTFDAISPSGEYLGGAIAPGLDISAEALVACTSKLPRVEILRPDRVVGRNTIASMQSGIVYGYVGLVEELVERMREELAFATTCIATGGMAALIAEQATCIDAVHEDLTLEGLRLLYERNA